MHISSGHRKTEPGCRDNADTFFRSAEITWRRSKEEVWSDLSHMVDAKPKGGAKTLKIPFIRLSAAAVILCLLGLISFLRFYSKTVYCPDNSTFTTYLPDGSGVELSAVTSMKYFPFWWRVSRNIILEGEAVFDVEKGNRFAVSSVLGKAIVLGTRFKIYSRGKGYRVTCMAGKVKVLSEMTGDQRVISPNERAEIIENTGRLKVVKISSGATEADWIGDTFTFTSMPLRKVLNEIERQYDVEITMEEGIDITHSGNFSKKGGAENALDLVCYPLGVKFVKISTDKYHVGRTR